MGIWIVIALILFWYTIKIYNIVKPLEIRVNESDSNIRVILQKRESILTKLNSIVNSYTTYERDIVEKLSKDMSGNSDSTFTINRLYDAYPDLKLNDLFQNQVDRLYSIETERQDEITIYNSRVRQYNETVTSFPAIIICNIISFKLKSFFN